MSFSSSIEPDQFDVPFRIGSDGLVATVPQGSLAEVGAAVFNIVTCPQGGKLNDPDFGFPSPLFASLPLNTAVLEKAIMALELRAQVTITQGPPAFELVDVAAPISGPHTISGPALISGDGGTIIIGDGPNAVTINIVAQVAA